MRLMSTRTKAHTDCLIEHDITETILENADASADSEDDDDDDERYDDEEFAPVEETQAQNEATFDDAMDYDAPPENVSPRYTHEK